jgi:tetratricopeptide (TPR) repeat protein
VNGSPGVVLASVLLASLAIGCGACQSGPRRPDDATDPQIYASCDDPEALAAWQRAQQALAKQDDAGALPHLRLVATRSPDFVRAHFAYQDCARRLGGASEQAMVDFYLQLPTRGSPVPDYLRARLAETAYAQSNALTAILARDPSFAWAHLSLARVQRKQGRLQQALDMFGAAIVNDSQLHEARRERAQVLEELGRSQEAAVDYRAYLKMQPDDVPAMREFVALLLYRLSQLDEAIVWIEQLERRLPGDVNVRMDRAAARWRGGHVRDAVDAYREVLYLAPTTARAALNIGLLYYEIAPKSADERQRFWPKARAAFAMFLARTQPSDGHEQFERTLGVPFRLDRIAELIGPMPAGEVTVDDLAWPG